MRPLPAGYRIVDVAESRKDEFQEVDRLAFGFEPTPETDALVPVTVTWDRTVGVESADGRLAAVHASYAFQLPVPGATIPCSGLTWVGARPDERRRGLLHAMIDTHFERSLARGEPVSALFAAEHTIYGRFGYGSAADDVRLTLPRGAALRDATPTAGAADLSVRLDTVDVERHTPLVDAVHRAAGAGRPGWITRDTPAHQRRALADPPAWRDGGEPLRIATVVDGAGGVRAYALFRRKEKWQEGRPAGIVQVREAAVVDAAAARLLWSFLLDLDLTGTVEAAMLPADDPLLLLLADQRGAAPRLTDNIWVRLLDVPTALAGRRYSAPVDVVLDVADDRLPANAGRWRLTTADRDDDGAWPWPASATRTDDEADLTLDVRVLGAAYLGARSLTAQGRAGLVAERTTGALQATAAAFAWPVAPLCSWVF
ncbi:GNAT family N-acetyltransferase [Cellulomonas sp. URHD0024]|uniref:GNAT family N-acetyltransferase n=1 Tax=Cellulomonas sp. URHD0024 TaxID=1302620 RepID=UPI00040BB69F|nr:GNAT family N-acetyltransferase [Cellulomonas sp. URHD0024]